MHVPSGTIAEGLQRIEARTLPAPITLPQLASSAGVVLGVTNHRGRRDPIVLSHEDRRRHVYVLGKTGMGKTTLMETMIAADLAAGRGLALIDPHGDLAEAVVGNLPKDRINHTIIFDPSDRDRPVGFNMLEAVDAERRPLVASGLVGIFKKLFSDSWGPRLEHTLRSAILALLEYPGATLLSVPLMLTNDAFRAKVVGKVTDPVVRAFWLSEFGRLNPTQRTETVGPILNKVGQFLSSPLMRNILGQPQSAFSLRRAMDQGKTVIVNLSKGKIGEDASALLGAMLVTRFQLDAMSRADVPEGERRDFTLYVDEFQNFATESFATILSEARKYRLSLVMANQYVAQMPEPMRAAVFGNVGSLVAFQVGPSDAPVIKEALQGDVTETDLINAKKHTAYLRLAIDGMPTRAVHRRHAATAAAQQGRDGASLCQGAERVPHQVREPACVRDREDRPPAHGCPACRRDGSHATPQTRVTGTIKKTLPDGGGSYRAPAITAHELDVDRLPPPFGGEVASGTRNSTGSGGFRFFRRFTQHETGGPVRRHELD